VKKRQSELAEVIVRDETYNRTSAICTNDILCSNSLSIFECDISEIIVIFVHLQRDDFVWPVNCYAIAFEFLAENILGKILWDDEGIRVAGVFVERREVGANEF
jgi:hypothetical protein